MQKLLRFSGLLALAGMLIMPVGSGLAGPQQQGCKPGEDYLTQLDDAFAAYDFEGVVVAATCMIEADPTDAFLYYDRAIGYYELGDYDAAIDDLTQAIEAAPLEDFAADALLLRGGTYFEMGNQDQALADMVRAIQLVPDDTFYYEIALDYFDAAVLNEAITTTELVPLGGNDTAAPIEGCEDSSPGANAGVAALNGDDPETAIILLLCATTFDYQDPAALATVNLFAGEAFQLMGDDVTAIARFNQALLRDQSLVTAYLYRGISYQYLAQDEMALDDFADALSFETENDLIYTYAGLSQQYEGNDDAAIAAFDRALSLKPDNALALAYRGQSLFLKGEVEQAFSDFDAAITLDEEEALLYLLRGAASYYAEQDEQALQDLTMAIELGEDNESLLDDAYSLRGQVYFYQGNDTAALEDLSSALEHNAEAETDVVLQAEVYFYRGAALYFSGDYEAALEAFNLALVNDPENSTAYLMRGQTHTTLGMTDAARQDYQMAFDLEQDDAGLLAALKEIDDGFVLEDYVEFLDDVPDIVDEDNGSGTRTALRHFQIQDLDRIRTASRGADRESETILSIRREMRALLLDQQQ